jgi:hypothetical protein
MQNTERAIGPFIDRLGGFDGLAVSYEATLTCCDCLRASRWRDVIAPSLVPVRGGDRVNTDQRDAKKLARL